MRLAGFYADLLGSQVGSFSDGEWADVTCDGGFELSFQRVEDYRRPRWPDQEHPQQFHLDFHVDEFEPEQRRVIKLGATLRKNDISPEGYGWQVYIDPAGHPFCLCRNRPE